MTTEIPPDEAPDPGLELVPADDPPVSPEEDLDAAAEAATEDPFEAEDVEDPPVPFGRTWDFDFDAGRMRRQGGAPALVTGQRAFFVWAQLALHTALGAHSIFTEEFGVEAPAQPLGSTGQDADEAADDWEEKIRDALTVHDRVTDVTDFDATYDPAEGVLYVNDFVVVFDEDERLRFGALQLAAVPEAPA